MGRPIWYGGLRVIKKWMERRYKILLAAVMAVGAVAAVWHRAGIFFATNDDRVITEILAGTITQNPDPHVKLVNWLLAAPLCLLYGVTGRIPWYGLCLVLFHTISWLVIFHGFLSCCASKAEVVAAVALGGGCFLINLYSLGLIQFTSTAALLATAGYVSLVLRQDREGVWIFGCMELLSCLLRKEAMLMVQPLGGIIFLTLLWTMGKETAGERLKATVRWAAMVCAILILSMMGTLIGYHGQEWREYDRYNQARIELFDYYGTPPYEEVKEILEQYQVTRVEYEAYCNYVLLSDEISSQCAEALADHAGEGGAGKEAVIHALRQSISAGAYQDSLSGIEVTVSLWLCLILWTVLTGRWKNVLPLLGLGVAREGVWTWIFYRGRVLPRVTYPLLFCESTLLLVIFLKSYACTRKNKWSVGMAVCLLCIFLVQGYGVGRTQYRYVKKENEGQAVYIRGLREIRNYCRSHSDRRFFLENGSFSFYKGSVWETDIYKPANGMYTGGWNANTPVLKEYLRTYMGEVWEDFYLIIYDTGEATDIQADNAVVRYFQEKAGTVPVLEERMTVSHGGSYLIWHFSPGRR